MYKISEFLPPQTYREALERKIRVKPSDSIAKKITLHALYILAYPVALLDYMTGYRQLPLHKHVILLGKKNLQSFCKNHWESLLALTTAVVVLTSLYFSSAKPRSQPTQMPLETEVDSVPSADVTTPPGDTPAQPIPDIQEEPVIYTEPSREPVPSVETPVQKSVPQVVLNEKAVRNHTISKPQRTIAKVVTDFRKQTSSTNNQTATYEKIRLPSDSAKSWLNLKNTTPVMALFGLLGASSLVYNRFCRERSRELEREMVNLPKNLMRIHPLIIMGSCNQYTFPKNRLSEEAARNGEFQRTSCTMNALIYLKRSLATREDYDPRREVIDKILHEGIELHLSKIIPQRQAAILAIGLDGDFDGYIPMSDVVDIFVEKNEVEKGAMVSSELLPKSDYQQQQEEQGYVQFRELIRNFLQEEAEKLNRGHKSGALVTLGNGTYAMTFRKDKETYLIDFFDSHGDDGDKENPAYVRRFTSVEDFVNFLARKRKYIYIPPDAHNQDLNRYGFCVVRLPFEE